MWEQLSEFLFEHYAVGGFQLENWMLVLGAPVLLAFGYFLERGFGGKPSEPPDD